MDYIFNCPICSLEYNRASVIPQVLECGHTFCSPCIKQLEANPYCPNCRSDIEREHPWNFPINYVLLSLIEEVQSVKNINVDIVCRIKNLKEKYSFRKDLLNNEISKMLESLKITDDKLQKLETLEHCNFVEDSGKKARSQLHKMEEEYREFPFSNVLHLEEELDHYATFSKKKVRTTKALLRELRDAVQNEKVYAFKRIGKKLKFGKLTVEDNEIFIHSLTLDETPNGSKTVPFDDLKNDKLWDYAFLNIKLECRASLMIQIQLVGNNRIPRFIKLFTGENGHGNGIYTHIGRDVKKSDLDAEELTYPSDSVDDDDSVVMTSKFTIIFPKEIQMDYYINVPIVMPCENESLIVREISVNSFQLMEVNVAGTYKILGRVIYPSHSIDIFLLLLRNSFLKSPFHLLDCGVMVKI